MLPRAVTARFWRTGLDRRSTPDESKKVGVLIVVNSITFEGYSTKTPQSFSAGLAIPIGCFIKLLNLFV